MKKVINCCNKPVVIDADGLNILAKSQTLISHLNDKVVLTPHLAELSRLTGESIDKIKNNIFKISASGDSSLSTGGTGDVLAGMIGSFLAQGMALDRAVVSAVYLHGKAGKKAGERLGQHGVIARDVIAEIPSVLKEY